MHFATKISAFASLLAFATASLHTEEVTVVCTDADPVTITQTVTVTAPCGMISPHNRVLTTSTPTPIVYTTAGGSVTSVETSGSTTSVWVYPTGAPSDTAQDATVSIYVNNIVINVIVVNINISIQNGQTSTIYSTKTDQPTWTPPLPISSTSTSTKATSTSRSTKATASSSSTITGHGAIHTVIVGVDGTLAYGANQVDAAIGDIIRFDFNSTNHTVTQSDFLTPCTPKIGGFNTGFNQVNKLNHTGVIFKDFLVDVSTPLWFYCAQTVKVSHCHSGMVLGVNPAGKFPAFLSMALNDSTRATKTSSMVLSTGISKPLSTGTGITKVQPIGTGAFSISIATGTLLKGPGPVVPPKPTATGTFVPRQRRDGQQWFA